MRGLLFRPLCLLWLPAVAAAFAPTPPSKLGVIFFSGANTRMPKFLYSDFVHRLEKLNVTVHDASSCKTERDLDVLVQDALKVHDTLGLVSHSQGSTRLVETANFYPQVKNIVLLDPVRSLNVDTHFKHADAALMVRATRAHEFWTAEDGPRVPFLLGFNLRPNHVSLKAGGPGLQVVDASGFGHVDICDANIATEFVASTVSQGVEDRQQLSAYREWTAALIYAYLTTTDPWSAVATSPPPPSLLPAAALPCDAE